MGFAIGLLVYGILTVVLCLAFTIIIALKKASVLDRLLWILIVWFGSFPFGIIFYLIYGKSQLEAEGA
ncbi:MAG: hypothetical protein FWE33_03375 [Defluviitaleaceae bacterium]|nr:hypothetical protein [Defluviitaleaceae bacterium]